MTAMSGEVFEKRNLFISERSNFLSVDSHGADQSVVFTQRNADQRAAPAQFDQRRCGLGGIGRDIGDVDDALSLGNPVE